MESIAARVRSGAIGAMFFALVMAAYLHDSVGRSVWYWLMLKAAFTIWRLVLVFKWTNAKTKKPAQDKWVFWIRVTLFLDGVVMGAIGLLAVVYDAPEEALLWTAAGLCGVTAVAMHTLEADWLSGLLYATPILGQTVAYLMTMHERSFGNSTALGVAIFGVVLLLNARKAAGDEEQRIIQSRAIRRYQKQNEVALEMARNESRMRTEMMSSITHELRTPIHGILAMSHQIAKDPNSPSTAKAAAMIVKSGEHLVGLINDVLDFGRLEAAGVTLRPEVFDLNDLVEELLNMGFMIGREKGVKFWVNNALARPYHVHADPGRLRQIALNLISNGIKFTGKGGRVTMRVQDSDGRGNLVIEVVDTGVGIPAENLATIFEPFSRHARSRNEGGLGGSGLGLSISKRLATAMKGTLEVASELGQGSTFTLKVRLEKVVVSLHQKGAEPHKPQPLTLKGHALIAEDDGMTAELARTTLEMHGMTVSVVGQGDMAVYACTVPRQRPDIVLMDSDMPGLDGLASIRRIRDFEAQSGVARLSIVMVSGRCTTEDVAEAHRAGADEHLGKPYTSDDLIRTVAFHLHPAQNARQG
jgi:signal transduction histidine kinase/CheY-like chemotaxis protein